MRDPQARKRENTRDTSGRREEERERERERERLKILEGERDKET